MSARREGASQERAFYQACVERFIDQQVLGFFEQRDSPKARYNARSIRARWRRLAGEIRAGRKPEQIDFYLHMPYCRTICGFCNLLPVQLRDSRQLEEYLQRLLEFLDFYADAFHGVRFANLQMGGGSPSILGAGQLERLFSHLFSRYRFLPKAEKYFEFHPASFSREKLEILDAHGFNTYTVGVQSLDEGVLARVNRGDQTFEMVERAVQDLRRRARGLRRLVVDLIMRLEGDRGDSFLESFEKTAALQPDEIAVYELKQTGPYVRREHGGSVGVFLDRRREDAEFGPAVTERMIAVADRHGFDLNRGPSLDLRYSFVLRRGKSRAFESQYSDFPLGGTSLFGVGSHARSQIAGRLSYSCDAALRPFDPSAEIYSGRAILPRDEKLKYLLNRLIEGNGVSRRHFKKMFGGSVEDDFGPRLRGLERVGALRRDGDFLRLASDTVSEKLVQALSLVGAARLRRMLDHYNSPGNQIVLSLRGVHFAVWVERARAGMGYFRVLGDYGLQVNKLSPGPLQPSEKVFQEWLALLFFKARKKSDELSAPEITFSLHEEIEKCLRARAGAAAEAVVLKPWALSKVKSGLGFSGQEGAPVPSYETSAPPSAVAGWSSPSPKRSR